MKLSILILASWVLLISCAMIDQNNQYGDELENLPLLDPDAMASLQSQYMGNTDRIASATHFFLVSEFLTMERNFTQAEMFLQKSYQLDPNSFLGTKLVSMQTLIGKNQQALDNSKKMVLLYPNSYTIRFSYGLLLTRNGNLEEAKKQIIKAIELNPDFEPSYHQLITIFQANKENKQAIKYAKMYTQNRPNSANAWLILSKIYIQSKRYKKALTSSKKAFILNNSNADIVLTYAFMLEKNGHKNQSLAVYKKIFQKNPRNEDLVARTVKLFQTFGDLKIALERVNSIIESSKIVDMSILLQRIFILWELNEDKKALKYLLEIYDLDELSDQVRYLLAMAYYRLQDKNLSLKYYKSIQLDSHYYLQSKLNMIKILQGIDKDEDALEIVDEVVSNNKETYQLYIIGAGIYSRNDQDKNALNLLERGIKKFPNIIALLFMRGVYEEKNGYIERCIDTMKQVIERDNNHSSALNYLGYLYAERGENLEEAEKLIKKALELKPNDGYFLDSLGWVYYKKGEYEKALVQLLKALELAPDEGIISEHIGDTYLKIEDDKKSLKFYHEALKKKIDEESRVRINEKIKDLQT